MRQEGWERAWLGGGGGGWELGVSWDPRQLVGPGSGRGWDGWF